mmetsp:Transcript_18675/g.37761  ORF Transcript_18675/g.37761 Transcript_18675/m.37761 type:complete len:216 (+) Transcript_18675:438-1085(+)
MQASARGHEDVIKVLIEAGANVHATTQTGYTPLIFAAREGHIAAVKLLVEKGKANVDASAKWGGTPLICAAYSGHLETVRYLVLEAKANPNLRTMIGNDRFMRKTAKEWAEEEGHLDVAKVLFPLTTASSPPSSPRNHQDQQDNKHGHYPRTLTTIGTDLKTKARIPLSKSDHWRVSPDKKTTRLSLRSTNANSHSNGSPDEGRGVQGGGGGGGF